MSYLKTNLPWRRRLAVVRMVFFVARSCNLRFRPGMPWALLWRYLFLGRVPI